MTKLNHSRPLFRYLDSIKRQIALDAQREEEFLQSGIDYLTPPGEEQIFPLNKQEADAVSSFFAAVERHVEAESCGISSLTRKATKTLKLAAAQRLRESAEAELVRASKTFVFQMVLSATSGRMNLCNLYKAMQKRLARQSPFLWETINEFAMRQALEEISRYISVSVAKAAEK